MMNPSSLVSKGPFAGMWSFPQGTADAGAVLWMRPGPGEMTPLGRSPGFADAGGGGHRDAASLEESTVTDQSGGIPSRRRRGEVAAPGAGGSEDESSRVVSTCSGNELQTESETKCPKAGGSRDENGEYKAEVETSSNINRLTDQVPKPSEAPKQDYIHVRARRGQATDSHSLAERARREKISEKMKILQDLVPGCNKVIGKALVLDEIINYVQSLQRQVEFLSMKLEALSSHMNPDVEGFPAKDHDIQAFDTTSGFTFTSQPTRDYGQGSQQEWLHMQVGGGI